MIDPRFNIDELKDSYSLEIRYRALICEHMLNCAGVNDAVGGKLPAQQSLPDGFAKVVEQPSSEPPRGALYTALEDGSGQIASEGVSRE